MVEVVAGRGADDGVRVASVWRPWGVVCKDDLAVPLRSPPLSARVGSRGGTPRQFSLTRRSTMAGGGHHTEVPSTRRSCLCLYPEPPSRWPPGPASRRRQHRVRECDAKSRRRCRGDEGRRRLLLHRPHHTVRGRQWVDGRTDRAPSRSEPARTTAMGARRGAGSRPPSSPRPPPRPDPLPQKVGRREVLCVGQSSHSIPPTDATPTSPPPSPHWRAVSTPLR
jgi:hypothetical protein